MARIDYCIKEENGQFNFSRTYNKTKLYSSDGQGYSRKLDGLTVWKANFKHNAKMVEITRTEFNKIKWAQRRIKRKTKKR